MTSVTLHEGDNRGHLRRLIDEGVRVHSVVTDPPYGLVSVTKRFGGEKAAPAKFGSDGAFARASAGFMGSKWDGTGIERDPEFWRLIHDILLPGGYVVAFASSRTFHRMAVAIEDAGFITHPMLGWVFGSGFPKAHNAAMAIDKHLGVEGGRGAPKSPAHAAWIERGTLRGDEGHDGWQRPWMEDEDKVVAAASRYLPGSAEAQAWDGWAYGAQAMKPALEPIYVGQKPFDGKTGAPSIIKHGVGPLNIDGCRVPTPGETISNHSRGADSAVSKGIYGDSAAQDAHQTRGQALGRHPANLLHDGSDDVVALFPQSAGQLARARTDGAAQGNAVYGALTHVTTNPGPRNDTGSAARFFNAFPADEPYPVFYHAKAGKADRAGSKHPTVKPVALMQWLCRLITPPGGTVLDPFAGSGTTGEAARREGFNCVLMEGEIAFANDIRARFGFNILQKASCSRFDDILGYEADAGEQIGVIEPTFLSELQNPIIELDLSALLG